MHAICRSPVRALNRVKINFPVAAKVATLDSQVHSHCTIQNVHTHEVLMDREYQSSGYGGGGGGGGYDGPHRRPFGRSQSSTEHPMSQDHPCKLKQFAK